MRRVLRDDGTLWLNIAGCYAGSAKGSLAGQDKSGLTSTRTQENAPVGINKLTVGLKPKDWVPIPWMLGMALQRDGWWLRSPIIWAKGLSFCETYSGSVMPESVRDRPTTSYEYVLLLTKSKTYFYDQNAVREKAEYGYTPKPGMYACLGSANKSPARTHLGSCPDGSGGGRNLRSVWAINPHPFAEAHFATFPPKLVEPCIKAGTSERGCCSAPKTKLRLREDLIPQEREKVLQWLTRRGILDVR